MFEINEEIDSKYRVIEELGRGGMGSVLKVLDLSTNQEVALKYCLEADDSTKRRFAREVRIMSSIQNQHVMPVIDSNLDYTPPYFIMPIAENSIVAEIERELSEVDALNLFQNICLGVQVIHNSDASHRDLKPDNILRMHNGNIVISDMGLAKFLSRDSTILTDTMVEVGTRAYSAPEQQIPGGSRDADERTDIFQLGKILYELLTGDHPALIDPTLLPVGLRHIIGRATEQQPDMRYQRVGELMDAVGIYIRSSNTNVSLEQAYDSAIHQASSLVTNQNYNNENIQLILSLLTQFIEKSDEELIDQFDRIPKIVLGIIANKAQNELLPILSEYSNSIERAIKEYSFDYAEKVAGRMKIIFDGATESQIKVLAIRTTMIASVNLNRYAAMQTFDSLLLLVNDENATEVATMLGANMEYYKTMVDRVPRSKLHEEIKPIYDLAIN